MQMEGRPKIRTHSLPSHLPFSFYSAPSGGRDVQHQDFSRKKKNLQLFLWSGMGPLVLRGQSVENVNEVTC